MAVAAWVAVGLGEEVALGRGVAEAARVAVVAVGQAVTACEPLVAVVVPVPGVAVVVPVPGVAVAGRDAAAVGLGAAVGSGHGGETVLSGPDGVVSPGVWLGAAGEGVMAAELLPAVPVGGPADVPVVPVGPLPWLSLAEVCPDWLMETRQARAAASSRHSVQNKKTSWNRFRLQLPAA